MHFFWKNCEIRICCTEYALNIVCRFWAISEENWFVERYSNVSGSSHYPVGSTGQWMLPEISNSSQQTSFRQKWLKIGIQYSKHILYNISESHNFFEKSAHVNRYLVRFLFGKYALGIVVCTHLVDRWIWQERPAVKKLGYTYFLLACLVFYVGILVSNTMNVLLKLC